MIHIYGFPVPTANAAWIVVELLLALAFIFANGFHDTGNAIAALVYTNSMPPQLAAIWSGIWNFIGAIVATGAVAYGVIALLPAELVLAAAPGAGIAMVIALLASALIWNIGTWYFGLPISSSHTLVGSVLGIGLANAYLANGSFAGGLNWAQAKSSGGALLLSPLLGFVLAGLLMLVAGLILKGRKVNRAHSGEAPPPLYIRGLLLLTGTGVSFAHGSNDGQKGMGLLMLVLIGTLPGGFAVDMGLEADATAKLIRDTRLTTAVLRRHVGVNSAAESVDYAKNDLKEFLAKPTGKPTDDTFNALVAENVDLIATLEKAGRMSALEPDKRTPTRMNILLVSQTIDRLLKEGAISDPGEKVALRAYRRRIDNLTTYMPGFVRIAAAFAIGLGTMVAWRRVARTIGLRIGKQPLTYMQGLCAETVAAGAIIGADQLGLPVSTTYLVSSGVAGTMVANRAGLQWRTVGSVLLAWIPTLPVSLVLSGVLFAAGLRAVKAMGLA